MQSTHSMPGASAIDSQILDMFCKCQVWRHCAQANAGVQSKEGLKPLTMAIIISEKTGTDPKKQSAIPT